mgnify:FL=1|tara:strand:+ start:108 stop:686 length:579 start_codon:yes stop_codon:yes gene_type:complete
MSKSNAAKKNATNEVVVELVVENVDAGSKQEQPKQTQSEKVHAVLDQATIQYNAIVESGQENLVTLRKIGEILIGLRTGFKSDKLFGQFIAESSLNVMTRRDRADAVWLAKNWATVQKFKVAEGMASASANYLRKKMTEKNAKAKKATTGKSKGGTTKMTAEQIVAAITKLSADNDYTTLQIITLLQNTLNA